MPVDLQHTGDTSLPSQFQYHNHVLSQSHHHNNNGSDLTSPVHSTEVHMKDKDEDLIAELTHHMDRFMLQDHHKFDFSGIGSHSMDLSWDSIGSPQSTLWSTLGSNQGSSEGSSDQEPSPPATPGNGQDHSCWKISSNDVMGMFDKMKLEERSDTSSKYQPGYEILHTSKSNIGLCSYQSLIQEQIRAIELSRLKQEHVLPVKHKQSAYGEGEGQTIYSKQLSQAKQQIQQQSHIHKKGKGVGNGRRATRPPRPGSVQHPLSQQQGGAGMRALFLGGSGPTAGTGVFFPRAGTNATSQSTNNKGKGCSTVLIPSRVVQALQLHFDQMAATSGSKPGGFPPLHDVLVSNRDGMYSLQKNQSQKAPANMQNEMILPQEWTY